MEALTDQLQTMKYERITVCCERYHDYIESYGI